ncbi:glycosyltransferase family 4 protein [Pseudocolwellia agarivorans]|uniref:glycosyltransferase family 4 protein n=1 Tax=Pseudocolwellia agarivorans TaxID=1911682 RepID=UPI00158E54B6|nr:glycosyltransferase family 1 protein [Pseudocolwellia agarivorans]
MITPKIILNGRFLLQNITGVQRVEREILVALDKLAKEGIIEVPEVILPEKGEIIAPPRLEVIKLTRKGSLSGHLWEQFQLPKYCNSKTLWCLGNTAPVLSLMSSKQKVVTMIHDLSYKYFPSAYNWKFKAFYSALIPLELAKSDVVVTVSNAEKSAILKHYPKLNNTNILFSAQNGGIPDERSTLEFNSSIVPIEDRNYGIYVGSLSKRKNAEGVLSAAVKFLQTYKNMKFVVIGSSSGVFDSFDVDIPEDVKDRLEMRGQVNDPEEIYKAFAKARFLLFPSFYEASPLPPIEAMTFGCPVISSSIPSLQERCGDAAIYCDANDQQTITQSIDMLMASDDLWKKLSLEGSKKASEYSWKQQTETLLKLSGLSL